MNLVKHPLRAAVETAIESKLLILERWSTEKRVPWKVDDTGKAERDEKGELVPDYVPLSTEAFSDWDGTQNCAFNIRQEGLETIKSISRSTIYQDYHSDYRLRAERLFKTLREIREAQLVKANKSSLIAAMTSEISMLRALAEQQTSEILQLRSERMDIDHRLNRLEKAHKNGQQEAQRQISALEEANANLVTTISKLVPIKPTKDER